MFRRTIAFVVLVGTITFVLACGGTIGGDTVDASPPDAQLPPPDPLSIADGCAGVFNHEQILDLYLDMAPGDWATIRADDLFETYVSAELRCGTEPAQVVGVRRKRSGGDYKIGLKVDINLYVAGQRFQDLKKLSLETGVSAGTLDVATRSVVAEYLSWRLMTRARTISGRGAMARVHVNGELLGVYINVEQVDKRFLQSRLGDNSGWLYKQSGGARDGQKTNVGVPNPHEAYFCFFTQNPCAPPSAAALETDLPGKLMIGQMLRFGAVNALMGNHDGLLLKNNNYYYYDWAGGRVYLPWDLDSVMKTNFDVFVGPVAGGTTRYTDVLYMHWEDDYDVILTELVDDRLALATILDELDNVMSVAGSSIDADTYITGSASDAIADLKSWWTARHAEVQAQVAAH